MLFRSQDTMEGILKRWVEILVRGIDEVTLDKAFQLMHQVADNAVEAEVAPLDPQKEMKV